MTGFDRDRAADRMIRMREELEYMRRARALFETRVHNALAEIERYRGDYRAARCSSSQLIDRVRAILAGERR